MGNGCPVIWVFSATPCRTRHRTQAVLVFQEGTVERPPACLAGGIQKNMPVHGFVGGRGVGEQAGIDCQ